MIIPGISTLVETAYQQGVRQAVLCPGSRCAPLAIAIAAHPGIQSYSIADERSAGFIALGMAQASRSAVLLLCTSGTAALNFSPAVAEAFYSQSPLLILTADRPPEWIDQWDGQTIRQDQLYGRHLLAQYSYPMDSEHPDQSWHQQRMLREALLKAQGSNAVLAAGPVHINIPIREPFYPVQGEAYHFEKSATAPLQKLETEAHLRTASKLWLKECLEKYPKCLLVFGQSYPEDEFLPLLKRLSTEKSICYLNDIISNRFSHQAIVQHDVFLGAGQDFEALRPDLVIYLGRSLISKNLKTFLRKFPPQELIHVKEGLDLADPLQHQSAHLNLSEKQLLHTLLDISAVSHERKNYSDLWREAQEKSKKVIRQWMDAEKDFSEMRAFFEALGKTPVDSTLHFSNSMPVRYANLFPEPKGWKVFANRGTSGIDGCTGTAVGQAILQPDRMHTLFSGDLAFFYDRNSLWHPYLPKNLRIILFNNQGGGIFRLIPGPRQQPNFESLFETPHLLKAENTAKDFDMIYSHADSMGALREALKGFFEPKHKAAILEISTQPGLNEHAFQHYKNSIREAFSNALK